MRRANRFGQGKEIGSVKDTTYQACRRMLNTSRTPAEFGTAILQSALLTFRASRNGIRANKTRSPESNQTCSQRPMTVV